MLMTAPHFHHVAAASQSLNLLFSKLYETLQCGRSAPLVQSYTCLYLPAESSLTYRITFVSLDRLQHICLSDVRPQPLHSAVVCSCFEQA